MLVVFQVTRLEQRQKLALTLSMQISIQILQMDRLALAQHVAKELQGNPFLKQNEPTPYQTLTSARAPAETNFDIIDAYAAPQSMTDFLLHQIGVMTLSVEERRLCETLVHCIDEWGFLRDSLPELSRLTGADIRTIQSVVGRLQQLEPTGVFSCDLVECLQLQLIAKNRFDILIAPLLERLDLVAEGDLEGICQLCGVDTEDAEEMIADIRGLNPRPCSRFAIFSPGENPPDLIMTQNGDQEIHVELNSAMLPRVLVDDGLFSTVQMTNPDKFDSRYYHDCYKRAGWLVAALQKRANTMLAIGGELTIHQKNFILSGRKRDLVPLQMEKIASHLGLNKSTISRALSGRTIMTDHGVFDAIVFFARKANPILETATVDTVLRQLNRIIKSEHIHRIYSDEEICQQLASASLPVARRTISKYRKMLNIPTSAQRRRQIVANYDEANRIVFHV